MEATPVADIFSKAGFGLARVVGMIEDWTTVIFAATVTISGTFGLIAKAADWQHQPLGARAVIVLWAIGWICLDLVYTARLIHIALRRRAPFALTAARERRMWPLVVRPIVVVWWLGHFVIGSLTAATMHITTANNVQSETPMLDLLMAVGFGFAANGFLILTVCAATRSERVRSTIWRYRAMVDIGMGLFGLLFSQFLRSQMS